VPLTEDLITGLFGKNNDVTTIAKVKHLYFHSNL
jgi:hypothetical protein